MYTLDKPFIHNTMSWLSADGRWVGAGSTPGSQLADSKLVPENWGGRGGGDYGLYIGVGGAESNFLRTRI